MFQKGVIKVMKTRIYLFLLTGESEYDLPSNSERFTRFAWYCNKK